MVRLLVAISLFAIAAPAALAGSPAEKAGKAGKADKADKAEKEILAQMETFRHAMLKKDPAAFDKVFHADLSYGHSIGLIENKKQATDHVLKSTTVYKAIDYADTKISVRGDTAFVTGKVHYEKHPKDQPVLHQNLVVLSVWVNGPKGWQMLARQSTEPKPAPQVAQTK